MRLKTFPGGIHPKDRKELTRTRPITRVKPPQEVIIPLSQHTGAACQPLVKPGDEVELGQKIGESEKFISASVHASVRGKVKKIDSLPHPVLGKSPAILIESDKSQPDTFPGNEIEPEILSKEEILNRVKESGIVGLGGAAFPSYVKLKPPADKRIDTFLLNGAECEPYLTCDYRLMLERPEDIIAGLKLIMKVLEVKRAYVGIESNKKDAVSAMRKAAAEVPGIKIVVLKTKYPQGAEKQLIKAILGREVPSGGLPMDVGTVVNNIGTAVAIYEAAKFGKPLYERVVTVTGEPVREPGNLLVRIGTAVKELIEVCGGLKEPAAKLIMGGPMMGIAQLTDEVPVIKGTSGILVLSAGQVRIEEPGPCIRCGRCIANCPVGLMPDLIADAAEKGNFALARDYGALDCIECGVCEYECPAKRKVIQLIKYAKQQIANRKPQMANGKS